ncbi:hypothetical protein JL722_4347 [Aureococcus anophagefferens]|nr:hypothetical protein JL722_4347 [Aureococcus anophagefferens]
MQSPTLRSMLLLGLVAGVSAQLASLKPIGASQALDVSVSDDGAFELRFGGSAWFRGGDVKVRSDGAVYSLAEKTLKHVHTTRTTGADGFGAYEATAVSWDAGGSPFVTEVRAYASAVIFAQRFPAGLNGTGLEDADDVVSGWPSLRVRGDRGFVHWRGDMLGSRAAVGNTSNLTDLAGGLEDTGPVCFFDDGASAVVSAASSFMSANHVLDDDGALTYGLMGRVKAVPAGHVVETIVHFSKDGVNGAMDAWGAALLGRYGKDRAVAEADFTVNYLGYSTDNGAFYYYGSEKNKTMEDTILDVHAYAEAAGIPYRYVLLDSWWYYQATDTGGVTNWTARPDIFPSGMRHVRDATGWPIVAHNRYWSGETVYAKQNGGDFDFIIEDVRGGKHGGSWAFPDDPAFWDHLIGTAADDWGLATYEQDWLFNEFSAMAAPLESATLARDWLAAMNDAALRHDVTIQYCMSWSRHMLQSVELQAVTQARASGDYHAGDGQWQLGLSSIFARAIGVTPTKDNFWSLPATRGAPRYPGAHEPHNRLEAAASTLSGPVAPSDPVDGSDVALILKSCAADGKLLQADGPATYLDAALRARGARGSDPALASSWRRTRSAGRAGALRRGPRRLRGERHGRARRLLEDRPLRVAPTDEWTFEIHTVAPVLPNGWAFLGETAKWIAVSNDRVEAIAYDDAGVHVTVRGAAGERVDLAFLAPGRGPRTSPARSRCTRPRSPSPR